MTRARRHEARTSTADAPGCASVTTSSGTTPAIDLLECRELRQNEPGVPPDLAAEVRAEHQQLLHRRREPLEEDVYRSRPSKHSYACRSLRFLRFRDQPERQREPHHQRAQRKTLLPTPGAVDVVAFDVHAGIPGCSQDHRAPDWDRSPEPAVPWPTS